MADLTEIIDLDFSDSGPSTNFGGGLELLMNDKTKDSSVKSDINLDDLTNLENELNGLVDEMPNSSYKPKSDLFNKPSSFFNDSKDANLGESTYHTDGENKTWDGYAKFNNIPMNPDTSVPLEQKYSKEELLREKFKYLRKLESLEKKGVELSKKYSMESSLLEMQGEYETIMEEKAKQNSVKFQGNMLMAIINGIEFLNGKFDPFDIKLDGWSEQVQENVNDYDDVFAELYDKYKSKASMAPELKLLFQLGGSAMMVHMTNTMFKSAMPGMDDILRQNPDLMRSFQSAAVNSMAQTSPGFSGFMNNIMGNGAPDPRGMQSMGGPPPPLATQGPNSIPPPMGRPGNNSYANRPDLNFHQGFGDGMNLRENNRPQPMSRTEMRGPSDLSDILSGLKTKTINIQEQNQNQNQNQYPDTKSDNGMSTGYTNDNSTISISDLKDLQSEGNMPKRSGRRKKSSSNTISLDI
jgi:hypothetical protein